MMPDNEPIVASPKEKRGEVSKNEVCRSGRERTSQATPGAVFEGCKCCIKAGFPLGRARRPPKPANSVFFTGAGRRIKRTEDRQKTHILHCAGKTQGGKRLRGKLGNVSSRKYKQTALPIKQQKEPVKKEERLRNQKGGKGREEDLFYENLFDMHSKDGCRRGLISVVDEPRRDFRMLKRSS